MVGAEDDQIRGGLADDSISSSADTDWLFDELGKDTMGWYSDDFSETVDGGAGNDTLQANGTIGNDVLRSA